MKANRGITAVVLSMMACALALGDGEVNGPSKPSFGQYYEAYKMTVEPNAPGYSLPLSVRNIGNYEQVSSSLGLSDVQDLIEQNGFAVVERAFGSYDPNRDTITGPYEYLMAKQVPFFVTADTVLHLYHIQFDETLKEIEEREFVRDINDLTATLLAEALQLHSQLAGDLQEATRRTVAFLAVAQRLTDAEAVPPQMVAGVVAAELALIQAHEGFAPSPLFLYEEDYSQYVPRGHYTRSECLKQYFRAMMWYGRMGFLLKGSIPWGPGCKALISPQDANIQTLQAMLLAISLQNVKIGESTGLQVWDRLYGVTAFYVGLADDLTPYDYLWALDQVFTAGYTLGDLADAANLLALKTELALLPAPKIFGGTGNVIVPPEAPPEYIYETLGETVGLRLMGQRFIPDSYMFQHLVYPQVGIYTGDLRRTPFTGANSGAGALVRGYPRGLDVMALLGSKQALHILIDEGETDYVDYWTRFGDLKHEFDGFSVGQWNQNLYWSWLYALKALVTELPQGYPNFMRAAAWQKKSLNAALASWTELRHDTILYAKQSYTPIGSSRPASSPPGYIEPASQFLGRLLTLSRMTRMGLAHMQVLSAQSTQRLTGLETLLERMVGIADRELLNQPLSERDVQFIEGLADSLESLVADVDSVGLKTTMVADVHTDVAEEKVVEEAVGKVDLIVVACPSADGSLFLAAGPVLSYYEFKHPMEDRLTDEAWRAMLDTPKKPDRPNWYICLSGD